MSTTTKTWKAKTIARIKAACANTPPYARGTFPAAASAVIEAARAPSDAETDDHVLRAIALLVSVLEYEPER